MKFAKGESISFPSLSLTATPGIIPISGNSSLSIKELIAASVAIFQIFAGSLFLSVT